MAWQLNPLLWRCPENPNTPAVQRSDVGNIAVQVSLKWLSCQLRVSLESRGVYPGSLGPLDLRAANCRRGPKEARFIWQQHLYDVPARYLKLSVPGFLAQEPPT